MALGRKAWTEAREILTRLLSAEESILRDNKELLKSAVLPEVRPSLTLLLRPPGLSQARPAALKADVTLHMPANIGDYTDFYASREHASNCGQMFRGKGNELNENWCATPLQGCCCRHHKMYLIEQCNVPAGCIYQLHTMAEARL